MGEFASRSAVRSFTCSHAAPIGKLWDICGCLAMVSCRFCQCHSDRRSRQDQQQLMSLGQFYAVRVNKGGPAEANRVGVERKMSGTQVSLFNQVITTRAQLCSPLKSGSLVLPQNFQRCWYSYWCFTEVEDLADRVQRTSQINIARIA